MVKRVLAVAAIAIVAIGAATTASAQSDAVITKVSIPSGQPVPTITENGQPYANGTYAIGTLQLFYTVTAFAFPPGPFATINLDFAIKANAASGKATDYPVQFLTLRQVGTEVNLVPATGQFEVSGRAWTAGTTVAISIPAMAGPQADGSEIVGHLQLEAPGDEHLKTTTTVVVHIRLVHPTSCLRLFDFVTDQELATTVTATEVNVNTKGKVSSTNPFGQLSNNVLVVNTCSVARTVGLLVTLDPWFATNPQGNPGNAVFTYLAAGSVEPDTFDISSFGTGTPQGQSLQMASVTIPPNQTFLMTVHMAINKGSLWTGGTSGTFTFSAQLSEGGSPIDTAAAPVTYTMK